MQAQMKGGKRPWKFHIFETNQHAVALIKKWFADEITEGNVVLHGDMHKFDSSAMSEAGVVPDMVKISIMCKWLTSLGLGRDNIDMHTAMVKLALPENWEAGEEHETLRQLQSVLRIINWAVSVNNKVMVDFENVESMGKQAELGIFKVLEGVARFKNVLNDADFSASHRCRLRCGNYLVVAAIMFGGPGSMWQHYLGNPQAGAKVAPAAKALCITTGSQNSHYKSNKLPLCMPANGPPPTELNMSENDKRCSFYNPVYDAQDAMVNSMDTSDVEVMLGYHKGMTDSVPPTAAKQLLAQVFAVNSQVWLGYNAYLGLELVEAYMVNHYENVMAVH